MSFFYIYPILNLLANSETTPSVKALSLDGSNPGLLPQFVEKAHINVSFKLYLTGLWNLTNQLIVFH